MCQVCGGDNSTCSLQNGSFTAGRARGRGPPPSPTASEKPPEPRALAQPQSVQRALASTLQIAMSPHGSDFGEQAATGIVACQ